MAATRNPMDRAIALARTALGTTSPNPAVGAVVLRDGRVVGEGYTLPPGQRHAEIGALQQAGPRADGATLYCTLEPCCHYGRTPPCTDAIISAGIGRVVYAVTDPNPRVSGGGAAALQAAGVEVEHKPDPVAEELYEAFAKHVTTGLPYVVAKFAMSLDGKIATRTGDSQWITGPAARQRVQQMRKELDGIMVGIGTALADDPQLTARDEDENTLSTDLQPVRVVVDSHARTPAGARMLRQPGRTIIATAGNVDAARVSALEDAGATIAAFPGSDNRVNLSALLEYLGTEGMVSVLVEGGGGVLGAMLDARLIDKAHVFIGPVLIGGGAARSPIEGNGATLMGDAWRFERTSMEQIGPDWLITGYPEQGGS
jgi:diaminohydroxyphosphoribosylaminopyrimidine deaminase/5-amino-6-(5-phosphoribosylamino)uracil reductase